MSIGLKIQYMKCQNYLQMLLTEIEIEAIMYIQTKERGTDTMKVGYVRISTVEQNTARQDVMMQEQGIEKVFIDKASGKNADRPQLQAMLQFIREGDCVTVESISRLARNTRDLLTIVEQIHAKGADVVILKENMDTRTPQGKFMLTVFAAMAELERESILQRQGEGIAAAKARDAELKAQGLEAITYKGRKPIAVNEDSLRVEVEAVRQGKQTHEAAMQKLGLKPNTYYRRIKALGL